MSELVRFLSGDNDVAQKTQMDPQNPTAKFVPLEPGQVLFGLEVVEDGSLLGTIYYDYKDKNGIITRVSMGNGGAGGSGGGGGIIRTLATTDGKHESDETTAKANVVIPLPKKIFANLLSAKTQFNFPKVHDPSNTAYVNEDAAPGQSYLYGNGLHMVNPFNTLQDSWIRTIGKSGSAEATLELAMRDNASNEYIYDQIVARHYKADGTIVTDTDGHKREVVILGKEGESQFPGPVTSQRGFVGDVDGNAKSATKAKQDWYDQVIDSTYLSKIVKTTHNGSKFEITSYDGRYTPVGSADAKKDVITIPGATTTLAGLVTTGDQTITGNKTINSSGTLTIMKQGGFIYSGIQEDKATDKNLPIWFSTGTANGTPNYSTELTYNPSTGTVTAKKFAGPATSATYDAEGGAIHDKYLKRAGGTMTGALNFADNTYNAFGDDVEIGSQNAKGKLNIHGKNGATGIVFVPYSGSTSQTISIDGAGVMTITGTVKTTLDGNASTATTLKTARNFNITDSSAAYSGPNVSFNGSADVTLHMPDTFAGTLKGNADTATKLATARTLWGQSFNGTANVSGNMTGVGNVTSTKTNTYTLGTSSNLWKAVYATTFYGALSGNADTATKLQTARSFHITDSSATYNGVSATFDGSAAITLHMPDTFVGTLKGHADSSTRLTISDGSSDAERKILVSSESTSGQNVYTVPGITANYAKKTLTAAGGFIGNASSASKLQTAKKFTISDSSAAYVGTSASFDGTSDVTLHMPETFAGALKGNADTATKLATARTLWGQSFNGTANVSGNMSNVGNVLSTKTNTYTIGSSSNVWKAIYATTFQGALSGNATSATKLQTARNFHITDSSATYNGPNASFNGTADITLHMPSTFAGSLKGNADTATNADKLDGYHRKGLYTSPGGWINANEYTKTVTVNGDKNTYYPVVISTTSEKEAINYISVWKNLGSTTAAYSSGNHSNGTSSMWLIYEARSWIWDGNGGYLKCWYRSMPYANLCAKAEVAGSGVGALVVYLRGGGTTYNISTTYAATVTVYLASTNIGSSSSPVNVAPTTSNGNLGKLSTVVLGYGNLEGNAATTTKWATARNFQVDLALDNPATVKVDGTKDVILPVTGILATKHGGTGQSSHTANRLVWSETATKLTGGYHYADTTHIGVNTTTKPSQNFYVTGTSYLNGDTTINGQLYMALSNAAITWNQGTYWQRMITEDDSTSGTHIFKFQVSSNSGSAWTDILRLANNGQVRVQNNVGGIYKLQTTASTVAAVQVISDNQDSSIFKVCSGTAFTDSWSCGFDLIYKGTGAGIDNLLTLYAGDYHNTGTKVIGWSVNQAGQMGIKTTPNSSYSLNINGNTYSNGKFYINNTTDVTTSNKDGVVVIGPKDGLNLGIDNDEIMARNATAVSTLYLNRDGGLVQIGSGGLYVTGQMKTNGPLLIGSDANGRTKNYIAFYGITGDGPDTWNHTFIGENLFGDTDKSELILFKGNDPGSTPEDMRYASGPGPDRIRHIAAGHLFQIYRTALSGTFATIAQSTVPISIFEVNQQGVVVYNEGTDANNYPAKITFKVKDTVHGTTSTATIAAYSDHGTASFGSNLVISSGGNTLIQAGDGTYGSYANLIGTGVNQGENLYLTADGSIQLCAIADTANRKLIWDGTTFYPSISNTFHLGSKSYRWASAHVYRDFNIYGTESTGDESHVRFCASDNNQRAIIAFNGNTTNTLDATTHLKIATNYGDIRLDAASNYINVKGHILPRADFTATNYNIGSTTRRWGNVYANALRLQGPSSDPSEAQGARIEFAYDNGTNRSQPVYISYTSNDNYRAPYGLKIFGSEAGNYGAWLEVQGAIGTSNTNASSGIGISLYGGPINGKPTYGMFFGGTATFGKLYNTTSSSYGVSSDWATYFTMSDTTNRGWLFMRGSTNVAGITGNGTFLSRISTGTHIAGNQGNVIIDGTAGAGYNMLFRQKSTNGVFTGGAYNAEWNLYYTSDSVIKKGTNGTSYSVRLINEAGNTRLNRLGINGENTSYQFYVNGKSYFNGVIATNSQFSSSVATGTPPFVIASTTVNANLNADLLDGFHESKFLRHRDTVSGSGGTSHSNSLWAQIGIRQYNNALPDAMANNATYAYGAVVSLPGDSARLDLWYNHQTSSNGNGLRYRTGWNGDKQAWATILDSVNYGAIADGRYVNVTGDTMTGLLTVTTGSSHGGIKMGNTYVTSISGDVIFQNNNAIRFGTDSWDYNCWAGLKYDHANKRIYLGLADGSIFTANAAQSGGRILTPGISYFHVGNQTSYYFANNGNIYGHEIYSDSWFRSYNTNGWYNETYGCHVRAHDGNYGSIRIHGNARNGYEGIHIGTSTNGMTIMSTPGSHQGLYTESVGRWIIYHNASNGLIALGGSSVYSGYIVSTNGSHRITGNTYCDGAIGAGSRFYTGYDSGVANSVSCSGWFRSSGNTGWYNASHDVGIYADNSTYLKSYGGKIFHSSRGILADSTVYYGINSLQYFNVSTSTTSGAATAAVNPYNDWFYHIRMNHANGGGYYGDQAWCFHSNSAYYRRIVNGVDQGWVRIWLQGNAVTGAVWNDYAEYRQADTEEAGYVLYETGKDDLKKTTERLQHFAGVSSDTWGFSQGETEKAKTPIAVAGRVLVYPYQDRDNYQPGDCVCAAPGGTVDIMTREEVIQYPDRIVGTVSCVPDYEEWGGGELADRDPVKVNGRIWIKVR